MMADKVRVNRQRLWASLMDLAQIGATENGGVCRLTASDEDRLARDLFIDWGHKAGCRVSIDGIGNIFLIRPGAEAGPLVLSGSHLDSQPTGGKFDGAYGVMAALEVIRTLDDHDITTRYPVAAVSWTNEEGARYAPSMAGSGVFTGRFQRGAVLQAKGWDGTVFGEELARIGYLPDHPSEPPQVRVFFEAHIEQGPILEQRGLSLGVVTGAQGQTSLKVVVTGSEAHSGTTPIEARRDALVGAAAMVAMVRTAGRENDAMATVGAFKVFPNSRNVVPGRVDFMIDLRHPDDQVRQDMEDGLRSRFVAVGEEEGLEVEIERLWSRPAVRFYEDCIASLRAGAGELGIEFMDMLSGAGHDACYLSDILPSGMIFVPCRDGISHNEAESADPEDLGDGCDLLLRALLAWAS